MLRLEDGRLLSWGVDKTAKLWNDDGTLIEEFLNEASWIQIERLKDGRISARIGDEYRVWSAARELVADLAEPDAEFLHVAHTPSGRILGFDRLRQ